jgi:hypothetical protein
MKYSTLLMVICLTFTLSACGGGGGEEPPPITDDNTPDDNTPDDNTPDDNTPDDNTPDDNTPDDNTPDDNTPDDNTPDDNTPDDNTPDDNTPDDNTPDDNTPDDNTPDDNTPDDNTPDDNTPDDNTPDDNTPIEVVDTASSFWFQVSPGEGGSFLNNGRVMTDEFSEGTMSSVESTHNNKLVHSINWTGNDLNGDGIADSLSFDIVVEGFTDSTYSYSDNANESAMTLLGNEALATSINNSWGVDGDFDIDSGESLRFSVENINVSTANTSTKFEGFIGITTSEPDGGHTHKVIIGEGIELDGFDFSAETESKALSLIDQVTVTGAGSGIDGRESAVSSIAFKITVHNDIVSDEQGNDLSDFSNHTMGPLMGPAYPAQQDFSNFPEFSWDKIPRWLIIRNAQYYTDEEVKSFADNYDLIVWEKANKASFDSIEEGILDTAARVRAINPDVKNIFYFNTFVHYTGYLSDAEYEENAFEWSKRETDENGDEVIWMFKDLYYWHNPEVLGMREWWINAIVDAVDNEQIDGVFVDKVTEDNKVPSAYDENGQPRTDYLTMLDGLDKALPDNKLYVGNTIRNERNYAGRPYMEFMDGTYLERWDWPNNSVIPAQSDAETMAVTIQMMREAASKKKIVLYRTGEADATSEELMTEHIDWPLAIYLITADQYSYFAYQSSVNALDPEHRWDTNWMDVFNKPLGAPSGEPEIDGFIYTRSFEHVDVWVNVETKETVIAWDSNDTDNDGMDDLWEYRNFGDLIIAEPTGDEDGDGISNLDEYLAGTTPVPD